MSDWTDLELADVLNLSPLRCACGREQHAFCGTCIARHVLASDWLAAHDAEVRATERERIAAATEAAEMPDGTPLWRAGYSAALDEAATIARAEGA